MRVVVTVRGMNGGRYDDTYPDAVLTSWGQHGTENVFIISNGDDGSTVEYVARHVVKITEWAEEVESSP